MFHYLDSAVILTETEAQSCPHQVKLLFPLIIWVHCVPPPPSSSECVHSIITFVYIQQQLPFASVCLSANFSICSTPEPFSLHHVSISLAQLWLKLRIVEFEMFINAKTSAEEKCLWKRK